MYLCDITLLGDKTCRTEVDKTCDQRHYTKIEPWIARIDGIPDQSETYDDTDRTAGFSELIYIHINPLFDFCYYTINNLKLMAQ